MKSLFTAVALIAILFGNAQSQIVRQNGSLLGIYTDLQGAVSSSSNGDTLYIPGGIWNVVGDLNIDKAIHLIGTGHNPDSSQATGITKIVGNINLFKGSSNGSLTGIYFQNQIAVLSTVDTIKNYAIRRCRIDGGMQLNYASSWMITEAVIGGTITVQGGPVPGFFFSNNFLQYKCATTGTFPNFINSTFKNNIIYATTVCPQFSPCQYAPNAAYSTFENNAFVSSSGSASTAGITNSVFKDNLFYDNPSPLCTGCTGSSNIISQPLNSIFNQFSANFDYATNYHLQSTSPGHNAGTDGNDVGIYGGLFPWKDGSVPPNPQVLSKTIQSTTDQNGNLQINVKVKAQNN